MQGIMRTLCIVYLITLTFLLVTSNPVRILGLPEDLPFWLGQLLTISHFLSFLLLSVLCLTTRWPVPRWSVVLFLSLYAAVTELVQGLVPVRTPQWEDLLQDMGGIMVGAAGCWVIATVLSVLEKRRQAVVRSLGPTDQWKVLQKVMSRPTVGKQSWWS